MVEEILAQAVDALKDCPSVEGIVLGGSRATGTAGANSDVDIGIYYRGGLDLEALNLAAAKMDDTHREGLICPEGMPVDLIFRSLERVERVVEQSEQGQVGAHYQTGHPHAYLDVMYRGELACSRVLFSKCQEFLILKQRAENYPEALREAIGQFFLFESSFSCMFAEQNTSKGDLYYMVGHLFRSVSALNQVLFALNRQWCLNEKKAVQRIQQFPLCPKDYESRVNLVFLQLGSDPAEATRLLRVLCDEVSALWAENLAG